MNSFSEAGRPTALPCDGCDYRSSCIGACGLLHKFLRQDSACHTRAYTREISVDPSILQDQVTDDECMWHSNAPEYWDIMNIEGLSLGDQELLIDKDVMGLSHQQIAEKWRISVDRVNRHFIRIKQERVELRKTNITP